MSEINVESAVWIASVIHSQDESDDCINLQESWESQTTAALQSEQSQKLSSNKPALALKWTEFVFWLKVAGLITQTEQENVEIIGIWISS